MRRRMLNLALGLVLAMPAVLPVSAARGQTGDAIDLEAALAPRIIGDPDAKLTLIEFYSLTCPACARFHADIYPKLRDAFINTGRINMELRDFPLDQWALRAAALARCLPSKHHAAIIDVLLKQQQDWALAEDPMQPLARFAKLAGLDGNKATACMTNEMLLDGILEQRVKASSDFGINVTPSFVLNGELIEARSFEDFEKHIIDAGG